MFEYLAEVMQAMPGNDSTERSRVNCDAMVTKPDDAIEMPNVPGDRVPAAYGALFLLFIALRSTNILLDPRFWAEEATYFYARFHGTGALHALAYVHLGSYQFLANLFVYLSTLCPIRYAPVITTYLSAVVLAVVAYQFGEFLQSHRIRPYVAVPVLMALALQWGMYEVALSATNVQWIAGLSVLLIAADRSQRTNLRLAVACLWTLVCGLSGIPAVVVAPIFLLRALIDRDRSFLVLFMVLAICAFAQMMMIVEFGTPERDLSKNIFVLILPMIFQTGIEPFVSPELMFLVGTYIQGALPKIGMFLLPMFLIGATIISLVIASAWRATHSQIVWILAAAWVSVSLVQTFGALSPEALISASGSRYYVFGETCLLLLLGLTTTSVEVPVRSLAIIGLLIVDCVAVGQFFLSDWTRTMTACPSWSGQITACENSHMHCIARLWPGDGSHYLVMSGDDLISSKFPKKLPALKEN